MTRQDLHLWALVGLSALLWATPTLAAQPGPQPAPEPAPQAQPAPQPAPMVQPAPQAQPAPQPAEEPQPQPEPAPAVQAAPPPTTGARSGRRLRRQNNRHALGVAGGMSSGSGFAYRYYAGNTMFQGSLWATITNRGDDATVWAGAQVARYLLVWHEDRRASILPSTSALRLVGGASWLYSRSTDEDIVQEKVDPNCNDVAGQFCPTTSTRKDVTSRSSVISVGGGIGFEFGAVMRPGFSVALDLQLTAMIFDGKMEQIWPLPSIALMYSW